MLTYRKSYYLKHPIALLEELHNNVKWFVQRGRRGYSDRDVWAIDWYLVSWLPQALEDIKSTKMGYPAGMTEKRWNRDLDKMIKGLKDCKRLLELNYPKKQEYRITNSSEQGLDLFRKHFYNLWT